MFPMRSSALPFDPSVNFPLQLWTQLMMPRPPVPFPFPLEMPKPTTPPEPRSLTLTTTDGGSEARSTVTMRQVDVEAPPSPLESTDAAAGLLLLSLNVGGSRYCSVICVRECGFDKGEIIEIPPRWLRYCAESKKEGNLNKSTVVRRIECGAEIVLIPRHCHEQQQQEPYDLSKDAVVSSTEEEGGYSCERCGKVFSYAYYRDKHLKYTRCVDNGDRKFPCPICTRSFEKRDRLRIHILHVHENHRPHCCNVCGKAFSQSSSLNKHLRVHSGERPYQCPFCPKAFTASSILRTHIRQHSGEKPFKCAHCGKAFASHAAHDSHVRRTHGTIGESH